MADLHQPTSNPLDLVNAIVADNSGIEINADSVTFVGADGQSSFYDGSIPELGIGSGILLTSGDGNPPTENTFDDFGLEQQGNSDSDLQTVADSAFDGSGEVQDVNSLEFSFTVSDPNIESVSFNLVFGSDEFPEFSNSEFVDVAAVFVNGQNVGLFNNDPNQPLSIIDENLNAGNFQDNANNTIPIEYDGVSSVLSIVAPVQQGENTIKFGIADTGDQIYDSGLFISNFTTSGVNTGDDGSGVVLNAPGTEEADEIIGDPTDQFIEGLGGNDTINPGDGNDVVDAGAGDDLIIGGIGSSNSINGGEGNDTVSYSGNQADLTTEAIENSITVSGNNDSGGFSDTLTNIETIQYGDASVSTDTLQPAQPEANTIFISTSTGQVGSINAEGEFTLIAETENPDITFLGLALSPENELYVVETSNVGIENTLYRIDLETGTITEQATLNIAPVINGLSFDSNGVLYGVGVSALYSIDVNTGENIDVIPIESETESGFLSSGALVFDPVEEVFYAASSENDDTLYSISLTGEPTVIGEIGVDVAGFSIEDGNLIAFSDDDRYIIDTTTGVATLDSEIAGISGSITGASGVFAEEPMEEGIPVYRFLRTDTQTQFYTTSEVERDEILNTLPQYELEGISFVGVPQPGTEDDLTGIGPVYRFFNTSTGIHLYTSDENERAFVEDNLDNYVFEGTPYYGYDTQVEGTVPLYRFYNQSLDAHFYTPSIEERDFFIESSDYVPEGGDNGIAFYVEPAPAV